MNMMSEDIIKKVVAKAVMNGWKDKELFISVEKSDSTDPQLRITDKNNNMTVYSFTYIMFSHDFARAFFKEDGLNWEARLQSLATSKNRLEYLQQFI